MYTRSFISTLIVLLSLSCHSDQDDESRNSDCEQLVCTEEFRTINVSIQNSEGEPVALDSIRVVVLANNRDITDDLTGGGFDQYRDSGSYPVFNDLFTEDYLNEEVGIDFSGYLNNQEVISENYKAGADCCHVYLISGETNLVLE